MKIAAVIQARMSSARFPGKILHQVHGRPLLQYVLDRADCSREIDQVIVATSIDERDSAIAAYCRRQGVECFRGSLDDVASRFRDVSSAYGLGAFLRVCGDSPLLDSAVIDHGVRTLRQSEADLVTNCFPRTFPGGQSVEVVRVTAFERAYTRMTSVAHLEHVTAYFYAHPEEYRIHNLTNPAGDQSGIDLSVNTAAEMARFERMIGPGRDVPDLAGAIERYHMAGV